MLWMLAAAELAHRELPIVAELLMQTDLGRVVAVDGHRLDRLEEVDAGTIVGFNS